MKKRYLIIGILVLLVFSFILLGFMKSDLDIFSIFKKAKENQSEDIPDDTVVSVNGEVIKKSYIDTLVEYKTASNKNAREYEKENGLEVQNRTVDRKEIIENEIRNTVIWQETQRLKLVVDYDSAYIEAKSIYEQSKADKTVTEELKQYMSAMDLTEEEYIEFYAKSYQKQLSQQKLYENVTADAEKSQKVAVFNEYVENLIKKSDIKYYE